MRVALFAAAGIEDWILLCGWSATGVIGYLLGKSKGKPVAGSLFGFLLGPVGWLLIAFSPDARPKCPQCKGPIEPGARKCRNCGSEIPRCKGCGRQTGLASKECEYCG
jgi:hypothetical protein